MAGIQVPSLKRMDSVADASVGRIDDRQLPDALPAMEKVDKAAQNLASNAAQYFQKVQDDAIDTETNAMVNEYSVKNKQRMDEAEKYQGNPAEVYNKLDEDMKKDYDDLVAKADGLSGNGRDVLTRKLQEKQTQFEMHKLQQFSAHQDKYDRAVLTASLDDESEGLVRATELVSTDPSTLKPFDMTIRRIQDLVLKDAYKRGGVEEAEEGTHTMTGPDGKPVYVNLKPSAQLALKKALSDNISNALETVIDSGHLDVAATIKAKYWDSIDTDKQKALAKNFEKVSIDQAASLLSRHPNDKKKILADFPEAVRIKIEDEAGQRVHDKATKIEAARERRDKSFARAFVKAGMPQAEAGSLTTLTDIKENKDLSMMLDRIEDPILRQKAIDSVLVPKVSDQKAIMNITKIVSGEVPGKNVTDMSTEEVELELGRMKETDKKYWRNKILAMKTETGGEEARKYRNANQDILTYAINAGLVKRDAGGQISGRHEIELNDLRQEFNDRYLDASGPVAQSVIKEEARKFIAEKTDDKAWRPPERKMFNGGKMVAKNDEPPKKNAAPVVDPVAERRKWVGKYLRANDGKAPTPEQLDKFILDNGGK